MRKGNVAHDTALFIKVDGPPTEVQINYWRKRCIKFALNRFVLIWKAANGRWYGEEFEV